MTVRLLVWSFDEVVAETTVDDVDGQWASSLRAGYQGQSGRSPRIPLEEVLKIDAHLKALYRDRTVAA